MKKILITGASGQLGSEIKAIGNNFREFQLVFATHQQLDICNAEEVDKFISLYNPFALINCAAYTAVDKAENEYEKAFMLNSAAVQNLISACEKTDAYIIHISTDYVFDGKSYKPYREEDATSPTSVYGLSKLKGEGAALGYNRAMVVRTAWLYSCFGANFVKTMLRLGGEHSSLGVVFDQIGTPTYARDLAEAILHILGKVANNAAYFQAGVYHYSNEGVCSWYDFAKKIMQLGARSCNVNPIETKDYPTPAQRPHYSVLNKSKIKRTYGISIPHWEDSLAACVSELDS